MPNIQEVYRELLPIVKTLPHATPEAVFDIVYTKRGDIRNILQRDLNNSEYTQVIQYLISKSHQTEAKEDPENYALLQEVETKKSELINIILEYSQKTGGSLEEIDEKIWDIKRVFLCYYIDCHTKKIPCKFWEDIHLPRELETRTHLDGDKTKRSREYTGILKKKTQASIYEKSGWRYVDSFLQNIFFDTLEYDLDTQLMNRQQGEKKIKKASLEVHQQILTRKLLIFHACESGKYYTKFPKKCNHILSKLDTEIRDISNTLFQLKFHTKNTQRFSTPLEMNLHQHGISTDCIEYWKSTYSALYGHLYNLGKSLEIFQNTHSAFHQLLQTKDQRSNSRHQIPDFTSLSRGLLEIFTSAAMEFDSELKRIPTNHPEYIQEKIIDLHVYVLKYEILEIEKKIQRYSQEVKHAGYSQEYITEGWEEMKQILQLCIQEIEEIKEIS